MKRLISRAEFQLINWLQRQTKSKQFEPKKITTNRPENPMRQPANISMFCGLSDSRTWKDKAGLPRSWLELPEKKKRLGLRIYLLRLTPH
ncbi:hypothetical protein FOR82_00070 [Vibrio parahaemolyticus]|nr:hypothetical protein [Vibrio parahaemolyticus]